MFFCDANIDINKTEIEKLGAKILSVKYEINGETFVYEDKRTFNYELFYTNLNQNKVKPVFLNPNFYVSTFEPYLKKGEDVCYIIESANINLSYNYIKNAIEILQEKYPDRKIVLIDTLNASCGYGEIVKNALMLFNKNKDLDETIKFIKNFRRNVSTYFMLNNLSNLKKIANLNGLFNLDAKIVSVKPVFCLDKKGKLSLISKPIGVNKAVVELEQKIVEFGLNVNDHSVYVLHTNNELLAKKVKKDLINILGDEAQIVVKQVSPLYAIYCGEGAVGISFHSKIKN